MTILPGLLTGGRRPKILGGTGAVGTAPANTGQPSISGTPIVGQTLTGSDGTWEGDPAPTLARQWLRVSTPISGATGSTYTLVTDDIGQVSFRVTGTNASGQDVGTSEPVTVSAASTGSFSDLLDATAGGPAWHGKLGTDTGATMTARIGNNGTWVSPTSAAFGAPTLSTDTAGRAAFHPGEASHGEIISPVTSASFSAFVLLQLNAAANNEEEKYLVLVQDQSATQTGRFSLELVADGAGGVRPRCYSRDAAGTPVVYLGTATGTVPVGVPVGLAYVRNTADGTQRIWVNGNEIALTLTSGTQPASWPTVPAGTWTLGAWPGPVAVYYGLVSDLAIWSSALSPTDVQSLMEAVSSSPSVFMADHDFGDVVEDQTHALSIDSFISPLGQTPAVVSQGSLGTASVTSGELSYAAGSTPGADSFQINGTIGGQTSRTATHAINITEEQATGDGTLVGGIDWAAQGYTLSWAKTPVAGQLGMSGSTLVNALNAAGWTIYSSSLADRISVIERGGIYCLRYRMPGGSGTAGEKHGGDLKIRPNGLNGMARNAVLRYEMFMPSSGGYVDIGAGGKLPGLMGASPGVSRVPGGGTNYNDAMSMRGGWAGSQRWAPYGYVYPNSGTGTSYPANNATGTGWNNQGTTTNVSQFMGDHLGVWLRIEMQVIWNTGTNSNGEVNLWMNSIQKLNKTGFRFIEPTDGVVHGSWMHQYTNYGSSAPSVVQPQIWDFYGFEIWTKA